MTFFRWKTNEELYPKYSTEENAYALLALVAEWLGYPTIEDYNRACGVNGDAASALAKKKEDLMRKRQPITRKTIKPRKSKSKSKSRRRI